jgi:hypothetical protein
MKLRSKTTKNYSETEKKIGMTHDEKKLHDREKRIIRNAKL